MELLQISHITKLHLVATNWSTLFYFQQVSSVQCAKLYILKWYLKRCVHKLNNLQKSGFEKIATEVVDMQTAKIQLNSGLAKYILYGSA